MHSQAALTIREWQRHELLADAAHERRIRQLPASTASLHLALTSWVPTLLHRLTGLTHVRLGRPGFLASVQH